MQRMKLFLVLTVVLATVHCDGGVSAYKNTVDEFRMAGTPGMQSDFIAGQIIGGDIANEAQFPWQVMIRLDLDFQCGGSLISDQWVVTAAHCMDTEGDYSVRLGTLNTGDFEPKRLQMDIPPENIFVHENYDPDTIEADIALIKLPMPVVLPKRPTDKFYVNAIRLPKRNEVKLTYEGLNALTSGWGRVDPSNNDVSDKLKWIGLPVISKERCLEEMGGSLPANVICLDTGNENGVCNGDSGGPMVILGKDKKYTLVGVTSFVLGDTCLEGPNAFVKVSAYLDWIKAKSGLRV